MGSIYNSLSIAYSGLSAAQVGVETTSQNISNAESDGYTRQRVVQAATVPLNTGLGNIGNGTQIQDIQRIFDNFVFDKYTGISAEKEYADFSQKTLEELSTYFPEIDEVGIKADLKEYYNMWQTFADNPDNDSIKLALAKQTESLANSIKYTQNQVVKLQDQINDKLSVNINEVNSLAQELAKLNGSIGVAESGGGFTANDLRDRRNVIERSLARLIGAEVTSGKTTSNIQIDSSSNTATGSYSLSVNGFTIVDGQSFHPLNISNKDSADGFYKISYERQDGVLIPMDRTINGGRIGSILDLRGERIDRYDSTALTGGTLQNVITKMDTFAKGLIESANNLYAATSTTKMESNILDLNGTNSLVNSSLNIKAGAFDIVIYDIDGNETARRTININTATTITGVVSSNSIEGQIKDSLDDNNDGNANNNIDDYINFNWATYSSGDKALELDMDALSASKGYTFAIEDNLKTLEYDSGSNFAGALGLNRFFDGDNAKNIDLNSKFKNTPTSIAAGKSPVAGDNVIALSMIQQQFESYKFDTGDEVFNTTIYGMFDVIATSVGIETNEAILDNQTVTAQFNAVELEYASVSKVSIDEEMTNLIKYQNSYGAAAKIISTIDQMMQTLLGMKQ
ncbi:MAG: flagellar hook-associated protein FlgK [Sulfurimonas sp.]|nr:MAG: flagellar hook-associated protein FlgK [Sulfurimonas sp.]